MEAGGASECVGGPGAKPPDQYWLRGGDLNPRPLGYEPNELPDCSTPRQAHDRITTPVSRILRAVISSRPLAFEKAAAHANSFYRIASSTRLASARNASPHPLLT